ncbi:MAG: hypothetical protein IKE02_04600 [Lachnospiraceae bacterium]|nr:hypothetical protein [Lachnospiraceae bacterium]
MPDTRTSHLNLYVIGSPSDNVGGHMITNYNYNITFLDAYIAAHDIENMTITNGMLMITALDGTTYQASVGDAVGAIVAAPFDPDATYAAGALTVHNGQLWRCTNAHSGAWDPSDFTTTTVAAIMASMQSAIDNKTDKITGGTVNNLVSIGAGGTIEDSGLSKTPDAVPILSSNNLVKSGGVYSAVKTVQDNLDKLGLSVVDGKLCVTYSTS